MDGEAPLHTRRPARGWVVVAAIALAGLLAVAVIDRREEATGRSPASSAAPGSSESSAAPGSSAPSAAATDGASSPAAQWPARRAADDPMAIGAVDAPVVMVEYADFQCPFCGAFARETMPELRRRYVDAGLLRIEWRDLPYIGPESTTAAAAGRAAAAQGRFWEFVETVYATEFTPNSGALDDAALGAIANDIGLDPERFDIDRGDPALAEPVARDVAEADALGLMSTPGFVINGQLVIGAQPLEVFVEVIDDAIAQAESG